MSRPRLEDIFALTEFAAESATAVSSQSLFKVPAPRAPHPHAHNPLRMVLRAQLGAMDPAVLYSLHFSELLREIADYQHIHCVMYTPSKPDIYILTHFLNEKAAVLCPSNVNATNQCNEFRARFNERLPPASETADRLIRFQDERQALGAGHYFWLTINRYLDSLQSIYKKPSEYAAMLKQVCTHLQNSLTITAMRAHQIPLDKKIAAITAFNTAINQLTATPVVGNHLRLR